MHGLGVQPLLRSTPAGVVPASSVQVRVVLAGRRAYMRVADGGRREPLGGERSPVLAPH